MQSILNELAAEGHEVAGLNPPAPQDAPAAPVVQEPVAPAPVEPQAPAKAEEPVAPAPVAPTKPAVEREERFVPVVKFNEMRHNANDLKKQLEDEKAAKATLEARIAELSNKPTTDDLSDVREAAKAFAEKNGQDPEYITEFAETLVNLTAKRGTSQEVANRIAALEREAQTTAAQRAETERQLNEANADKYFDAEFTEILKKHPDLAGQKEDIKQLAFSTGYKGIPLHFVALDYKDQNPPGRRTAEVPVQGKNDTTTVLDFANMTDDQLAKLTPEQMDQFEAWMDKSPARR